MKLANQHIKYQDDVQLRIANVCGSIMVLLAAVHCLVHDVWHLQESYLSIKITMMVVALVSVVLNVVAHVNQYRLGTSDLFAKTSTISSIGMLYFMLVSFYFFHSHLMTLAIALFCLGLGLLFIPLVFIFRSKEEDTKSICMLALWHVVNAVCTWQVFISY